MLPFEGGGARDQVISSSGKGGKKRKVRGHRQLKNGNGPADPWEKEKAPSLQKTLRKVWPKGLGNDTGQTRSRKNKGKEDNRGNGAGRS